MLKKFHFLIAAILFGLTVQVQAADISFLGDFIYEVSDDNDADKDGFNLGAVDLFVTESISKDASALVEILINDDTSSEGFKVSIERYWVQKAFNPSLKLSFGRHHTPLGYYVRQYHHGALLDLSTARPQVLTHVVPLHMVGIMAQGTKAIGGRVYGYEFATGNGPSVNTESLSGLQNNDSGDPGDSLSSVLRIYSVFDSMNFTLGGSFMSGSVPESGSTTATDNASGKAFGDTLVDQTYMGLDFNYENGPLQILSEYLISNSEDPDTGIDGETTAFFVQPSWRFGNDVTIGYRFESLTIDDTDPLFGGFRPRPEADYHVAVIRYDVEHSHAMKLVFQRMSPETGDDSDTLKIQWAFLIP